MSGAITGTTLAVMAGVGAAGSIGGALIGSHAAGQAASTQANAADTAAQLQYQASQNALNFQEQQWNQQQSNLAPWLQSGAAGLSNLDYLLGITPPNTQGQIAGGPLTPNQNNGGIQTAGGPAMPNGSPYQLGTGSPTPTAGGPSQPANPLQLGSGAPSVSGGPTQPSSRIPTRAGSQPVAGSPQSPAGGTAQFGGAPASTGSTAFTGGPQAGPSGSTNLGSTVNPSLGGFGSLMQGYGQTFQAPTSLTEQNDPGYQARLNLGTQALQQSAAARGSLLTGGTAKALDTYGQDYASNEYNNVYNRAYNTFASNYNQYNQDQTNQYNRLAALAGIGQQTASQLGTLGQNAANGVSSNLLNTAQNMGQDYQNAASANASGIVGSANSWNSALGNTSSNLQNLLLLSQLQNSGAVNYAN